MKLIQKLFGGKAEAEAAQVSAQKSLGRAQSRTAEIEQLTGRVHRHGVINHIGERVEAAWKGAN